MYGTVLLVNLWNRGTLSLVNGGYRFKKLYSAGSLRIKPVFNCNLNMRNMLKIGGAIVIYGDDDDDDNDDNQIYINTTARSINISLD